MQPLYPVVSTLSFDPVVGALFLDSVVGALFLDPMVRSHSLDPVVSALSLDSVVSALLTQLSDVTAKKTPQSQKDNTPKLSLKEVLGNISILQRASLLLIGDSVIRHINPKQFTTHSESLYKVCVPGVTTRDLYAWVHSLPIMCSVKAVTLHVGIHDCPAEHISQNNSYKLTALLKKVFPNASLSFSSVIPAKGKHSLNNLIAPSNRNLFKVCQDTHVAYIDNAHTFTAPSGALHLVLYQGLTHPSKQGMVR